MVNKKQPWGFTWSSTRLQNKFLDKPQKLKSELEMQQRGVSTNLGTTHRCMDGLTTRCGHGHLGSHIFSTGDWLKDRKHVQGDAHTTMVKDAFELLAGKSGNGYASLPCRRRRRCVSRPAAAAPRRIWWGWWSGDGLQLQGLQLHTESKAHWHKATDFFHFYISKK